MIQSKLLKKCAKFHRFKALLDGLEHIGKVKANEILAPLTTHPWGYRRKARLGVKYVFKKEKVLCSTRLDTTITYLSRELIFDYWSNESEILNVNGALTLFSA